MRFPEAPMTTVASTIEAKLRAALSPVRLAIIDESALHAGHAAAHPGGETHFRIEIVAAAFGGKTRVERQRLVYDVLAVELAGPVHALSVRALTPAEAARG
jgi:BolA protein